MAVEADAVARALELIDDDRLVAGARVLRAANISPSASASSSSSSDANLKLAASLRKASRVVDVVRSLKATPDERSGWLVQGEHMGKRDVSIYYRLDPETTWPFGMVILDMLGVVRHILRLSRMLHIISTSDTSTLRRRVHLALVIV